jgi:hypothetical protein
LMKFFISAPSFDWFIDLIDGLIQALHHQRGLQSVVKKEPIECFTSKCTYTYIHICRYGPCIDSNSLNKREFDIHTYIKTCIYYIHACIHTYAYTYILGVSSRSCKMPGFCIGWFDRDQA